MKNTLFLRLYEVDTIENIISGLKKGKKWETIYFLCPKNTGELQNVEKIEELKNFIDTKKNTNVIFVQKNKIHRDFLNKHNLTTQKEVPNAKWETLFTIQHKIAATKNRSIKNKQKTTPLTHSETVFTANPIEETPQHKYLRSQIFFGLLFLLGILMLVLYLISPSAKIILQPRVYPVEVTQNVLVSLAGANIPKEEANLPRINGISVSTTVSGQETYPTSDVSYEVVNAEGLVMLYNETTTAKTLVPSRLMTETGEVFRFNETITIPPRNENGPGELPVEVRADTYDENEKVIGKRGNIPAGTNLFFPALKADSQKLFYAKANLGPLVKGDTLERYFLSEKDREGGKKLFTQTHSVQALETLNEEIENRSKRDKAEYKLIKDESVKGVNLIEYLFPEEDIGKEQDVYQVEGVLKVSGMVFDEAQVYQSLQTKLKEAQDPKMKLLSADKQSLDYRIINTDNLTEDGWLKMSVSLVGTEALDLNATAEQTKKWEQSLKRQLLGITRKDARSLLGNYPEIEQVLELSLRPFWTPNLPLLEEQIHLKLQY